MGKDGCCWVCSLSHRDATPQPKRCQACLSNLVGSLTSEVALRQQRAGEARARLTEKLQRLAPVRRENPEEHSEAALRTKALGARCSTAEREVRREQRRVVEEETRVSAEEVKVADAWRELREKKDTMVTQVLEPLTSALGSELAELVAELADVRRARVMEALALFQLDLHSDGAEIQGMPLPRFIHSFNRPAGAAANADTAAHSAARQAVAALCRLTAMVARYLSVGVPFTMEHRPTHCVILGGGRQARLELALSPPLSSSAPAAAKPPGLQSAADADQEWMRLYRRALHLLALNVRHVMRTQVWEGTPESEALAKLTATNDISPAASLRTLLAACRLPHLGLGAAAAYDYAYQEEQQFALMGRNGEITVGPLSPSSGDRPGGRGERRGLAAGLGMSVAAGGDLVCGDTTDFSVVLAPPPSETPDF